MRPGFAAALEQIAGNGVRTIIVETANRFARDLIVQETGFRRLQADGITLIAADKPDSFVDDTPTAVLVRQILGAVAQFDKAMTVASYAVPASASAARPASRSRAARPSPRATQRQLREPVS
jgi:DNA invertase Pin-like site-specific DNA recombinase